MPRKITPTMRQALNQYLLSRHDLSAATLGNDRSVLQRFIRGVGDDRQIGNVTPLQVERWFATECAMTNKKESSYNKARQRVGLFLRYCARHGWVRLDLLQDVRKKDEPKVERVRLDPDAMLRLLDVVSDPLERGLIACAINTGLRAGEITRIKIKDVDLNLGEIYVFRSKTKGDDRIPITARLDQELRRWMTSYSRELGEVTLVNEMLLFPARHAPRLAGGNEPGEPRIMRLGALQPYRANGHPARIIQRALPKVGITVTFQEGLHTVRRSTARALFEYISANSGQPGYDSALRVTASFLGHASTATTELYLGLSGDRRKRDEILRGNDFLPPDRVPNVIQIRAVP